MSVCLNHLFCCSIGSNLMKQISEIIGVADEREIVENRKIGIINNQEVLSWASKKDTGELLKQKLQELRCCVSPSLDEAGQQCVLKCGQELLWRFLWERSGRESRLRTGLCE